MPGSARRACASSRTWTGRSFVLTPEAVVDIQNILDSDIQMVLDHFAPHPASRAQDEKALDLTGVWAARARERFLKTNRGNFQFGIIQGGLHDDLRQRSLESWRPWISTAMPSAA